MLLSSPCSPDVLVEMFVARGVRRSVTDGSSQGRSCTFFCHLRQIFRDTFTRIFVLRLAHRPTVARVARTNIFEGTSDNKTPQTEMTLAPLLTERGRRVAMTLLLQTSEIILAILFPRGASARAWAPKPAAGYRRPWERAGR